MATIAQPTGPDAGVAARADRDLMMPLVAVALVIGALGRTLHDLTAPLWFDETFSAVIASQRDAAGLLRWCLMELSGPVYYGMLWAWEKAAGDGNVALRLPSVAAAIAAPALILWRGHPDRGIRSLWAAALALWVPAFDQAADARPYTLLVLLATAQAIAFLALLRAPARARAALWVGVSALAVLTHYYAAPIAVAQGIAFLVVHRARALACWPAALLLLPVAAWMTAHLPRVLQFSAPTSSPDRLWGLAQLVRAPEVAFGVGLTAPLLALAMVVSVPVLRGTDKSAPRDDERDMLVLALAGLTAFALIFATGFVRPNFEPRYAMSCVPALLAGVALWLRALGRRRMLWRDAVLALLIVGAVPALLARLGGGERPQSGYSFELASDWLVRDRPPGTLLFYWDHPYSVLSPAEYMIQIAGYFAKRAGVATEVRWIARPASGIAGSGLFREGARGGGTALIFITEPGPSDTAAHKLPRPRQLDAGWTCRNFGDGRYLIAACRR